MVARRVSNRQNPDRRLQETRGLVNVDFFRRWTPDMAYVLGYFAADGCAVRNQRGSHYLRFDSVDRRHLETVRELLGSRHAISLKACSQPTWQPCYQLQIGSRRIFMDLERLGFGCRKERRMRLPAIPRAFLADFVRGYFDGDGCVSHGSYRRLRRPSQAKVLLVRFTSASAKFLAALRRALADQAGLGSGSLVQYGTYACLSYGIQDSVRLFRFMYGGPEGPRQPYLDRKYVAYRTGVQSILQGVVV